MNFMEFETENPWIVDAKNAEQEKFVPHFCVFHVVVEGYRSRFA